MTADPRDVEWCEWCGNSPAPAGYPCQSCAQLGAEPGKVERGAYRNRKPAPAVATTGSGPKSAVTAQSAPAVATTGSGVRAYLHYRRNGNPIGVWHLAGKTRDLPACRSNRFSWEKGADVTIKESDTPPQVGRFCYICAGFVARGQP